MAGRLPLNVEEVRTRARRRLPRGVYEYVARGAEDETGLRQLREGFEAVRFLPKVLVDVSARDLGVELLGRAQPLPLVVAPTASAGLAWHDGECALARAAAARGVPFCVATESLTAMERIAEASTGPLWFQLYPWKDRGLSWQLLDRARATGIDVLVLTADTVAPVNREYNIRNGYGVPIRPSLRGALDLALHPGWTWRVLGRYARDGALPAFQHHPAPLRSTFTRRNPAEALRLADDMSWEFFAELRRRWPGKLVLKGVLRPDDAAKAADHGADAIVVSSHGARNLDGAVAPIRVLPRIADTVGHRLEILADSGVRRGTDVLKLLACGARAVLVGRATLFGTAWAGEAGALHVLDLLAKEMLAALGFLGCARLGELCRSFVSPPEPA